MQKSKTAAAIESLDEAENGLRVEFSWHDDRFAHKVYGVASGESSLLLKSVEGDAGEYWPCSPALQEFSESTIRSDVNQGVVHLLVGAAGATHWAMSVDAPEHKTEMPTLNFDIACRLKSKPSWLGSTYDLQGVSEIQYGVLNLNLASNVGVFQLLASAKKVHLGLYDCQLHLSDKRISLYPEAEADLSLPTTIRWRYQLSRLG